MRVNEILARRTKAKAILTSMMAKFKPKKLKQIRVPNSSGM